MKLSNNEILVLAAVLYTILEEVHMEIKVLAERIAWDRTRMEEWATVDVEIDVRADMIADDNKALNDLRAYRDSIQSLIAKLLLHMDEIREDSQS